MFLRYNVFRNIKGQDVLREVNISSCRVGSKQLNSFNIFLKLASLTRPLPPQCYINSKHWGELPLRLVELLERGSDGTVLKKQGPAK